MEQCPSQECREGSKELASEHMLPQKELSLNANTSTNTSTVFMYLIKNTRKSIFKHSFAYPPVLILSYDHIFLKRFTF